MQKGEQVTRLLPWLNNMLFLKSCQIDREVEMLWKFYSYYLRLMQIAVGTATLVVGVKVLRKERGEDDEK